MSRKSARRRQRQAASPRPETAETAPGKAAPRRPRPLGAVAHAAVFLVLLGLTCLLYAPAADLGFFHLDDAQFVVDNPLIREASAANVKRILLEPWFANYTPVLILSYLVDHSVGGLDPHVFHWSSIVWAGLGAGFLYLLGLALTRSAPVAAAAAALFVVHPAHVEAVVWLSSRKDLVACAFALPAMLCHLRYRRGRHGAGLWYGLANVFYLLAIAGKQSVAVVPAILLVLDLVLWRRADLGVWLDKIPYGAITALFALRTAVAQPETGHAFTLWRLGWSLLHNLWLLTGFGDYVIYRPEPPPLAGLALVALGLVPLAALAVPLLMFRAGKLEALPLALWLWLLLAVVPPQVLGFVHPVTDRYLFFPSTAFCLLVAWSGWRLAARLGRWARPLAVAAAAVLALVWARGTRAYLDEWHDPRSVWFAAARKSDDVNVHLYLGSHYQDEAARLGKAAAAGQAGSAADRALARALWTGDERLAPLLAEWDRGGKGGEATDGLVAWLDDLAWQQMERAVAVRSTRNLPNLFYRRGKLLLERGDLDGARRELELTCDQASGHTYLPTRQEMTVRCHYALGVVAWHARDFATALAWLKQAEAEQGRFGGRWEPEVEAWRRRLEKIAGRDAAPTSTPTPVPP